MPIYPEKDIYLLTEVNSVLDTSLLKQPDEQYDDTDFGIING